MQKFKSLLEPSGKEDMDGRSIPVPATGCRSTLPRFCYVLATFRSKMSSISMFCHVSGLECSRMSSISMFCHVSGPKCSRTWFSGCQNFPGFATFRRIMRKPLNSADEKDNCFSDSVLRIIPVQKDNERKFFIFLMCQLITNN